MCRCFPSTVPFLGAIPTLFLPAGIPRRRFFHDPGSRHGSGKTLLPPLAMVGTWWSVRHCRWGGVAFCRTLVGEGGFPLVGLPRLRRRVLPGLLPTRVLLLGLVLAVVVVVVASVAEECDGGCGWTNALATRVVLRPLRLLVVAGVVPLVPLGFPFSMEGVGVVPRVVVAVGSLAHRKGLAGSGCGIPVAPELGPVPRRMSLLPWLGPSLG